MEAPSRRWFIAGALVVAAAVVVAGVVAWQAKRPDAGYDGIASGNGRIEAVEIDVAARVPGRIDAILVAEGDYVRAGQVIARMDTDTLQAQLRQGNAQLEQARNAVDTARAQIAQRESEKAAGQATVAQRAIERDAAQRQLNRSTTLADKGFLSAQALDDLRSRAEAAAAAVAAANAQVAAAQAAIANAKAQLAGEQSAVGAMVANVERIQADIDDASLVAPRDGRVQYLVAHAGEVVAGGGRVLNLVDLSDVYMTFFLPTASAGRVALGADVRIVLDAAREYVIPAQISLVADVAQFTPKTVETASEREKLMFRVRARIAPELLRRHVEQVKTGLPGMAYVRLDPNRDWPPALQVKLPP